MVLGNENLATDEDGAFALYATLVFVSHAHANTPQAATSKCGAILARALLDDQSSGEMTVPSEFIDHVVEKLAHVHTIKLHPDKDQGLIRWEFVFDEPNEMEDID